MDDDKLDGRKIVILRGDGNDMNRLADALAEACVTEIFSANNNLVLLDSGRLVPVSANLLRDIIAQRVVSIRAVNGAFGWVVERFAFDFDQRMRLDLVGLLVGRVAKVSTEPRVLTEQQQREIRARRREGEPADSVAQAYGVEVDVVRQLAQS